MKDEPTLQSLSADLRELSRITAEHIKDDGVFQTELTDTLTTLNKTLEPISKAYNGVLWSSSFVTGIAGVILAFGAIIGGVIWIIMSVVNSK